ncbi:MAG: GTPase Era [Burkholderiales bacterium]
MIAVVGRPNVGKSSLTNALIGDHLSITSSKPQTTRHQIKGILSLPAAQYIFVDTPGFQTQHRDALNQLMNRSVKRSLRDVDVVLMVIEAGRFEADDRKILAQVPEGMPLVLAINKIDTLNNEKLLPFLQTFNDMTNLSHLVPVSAEKRRNTDTLLEVLLPMLPIRESLFDEDSLTDRSERFLAAERIREKLFRQLGDEIPYGATVVIEKFEEVAGVRRIFAAVVVEKESHKPILIGAGGKKMKAVASAARTDLEKLFAGKVYLEVWVKVRAGWTDNSAMLAGLGYD